MTPSPAHRHTPDCGCEDSAGRDAWARGCRSVPGGELARVWGQGWKTAVAWMRLGGVLEEMPLNPYESGERVCSCGCGAPVGDS